MADLAIRLSLEVVHANQVCLLRVEAKHQLADFILILDPFGRRVPIGAPAAGRVSRYPAMRHRISVGRRKEPGGATKHTQSTDDHAAGYDRQVGGEGTVSTETAEDC